MSTELDPERERLRCAGKAWKTWGPYLTERQWGTVREDYSPGGDAWEYLSHDQARSRAYRWGEDGIGGFSDDQSRLCLAVALWNGRDPILKERLFGVTNGEGNHGEDVKEAYYYLDATPTHSYLRMLYKYPQAEFPYSELLQTNRSRTKTQREFELADTGVFEGDRYFDVEIEYARAGIDDALLTITVHNRGPEAADIHVLPQLWFRNTWSWSEASPRPLLQRTAPGRISASHHELGEMVFELEGAPPTLFCDNETNTPRLFGGNAEGFFKDAIGEHVVAGDTAATNPSATGTKVAGWFRQSVPAGGTFRVRARLRRPGEGAGSAFAQHDAILAQRRAETDAFYAVLQKDVADPDARLVQRQAFAGMIWTKQFYMLDVFDWVQGDEAQPPPQRSRVRNEDWQHLTNADIISMPDAWEYPWYAAWELAFHCIPLALIDVEFAKGQLELLTSDWYMHPNGQLPAYEWAFDDANPPVHAWATWRVYQIDRKRNGGKGDRKFLERVFHKLLLNFGWWINRKDHDDNNVFQGGFLGLDNIGVFDRSKDLPTGGHIDQADGTAWMAMYSLNLMRIALELALENEVYEDMASKFFEHFLYIAKAMAKVGETGLWDEDDEFYYDWLHLPNDDGSHEKIPLRVRSMVGLIPLFAVEVLEPKLLDRLPRFKRRLEWFLEYRPDLAKLISHFHVPGKGQRRLLSLLRGHRMKCLIRRMADESEFLSPYGVRAMSRVHLEAPFRFEHGGVEQVVRYTPAESDSYLFGGNSNWRGPVWMPVNYLLIESLQRFHHYYGDDFLVEFPTGSGNKITLEAIAADLSVRLTRLFLRDDDDRRPVFGDDAKHQTDPHFRDLVLFYEYFDGDNGRGVGASHQTGWTGLVAKLIQPRLPATIRSSSPRSE
ncbi:MAG: glucosidase [Nannocystaceae bacterium]|nr:glucosidase [Nannocystaceae bacterium]